MREAWRLGGRILLAATCLKCGKLFQGNRFGRHVRSIRDRIAYVDRRCPDCKWGAKLKGRKDVAY